MRAKLITIFLISFGVFVGVLVWRFDDVLFSDKLKWNEAQSRGQMASMVKALEGEIRNINDVIRLSLPYMDQESRDFSPRAPLDRLHMIAKLGAPSIKNGRTEWQVISSYFQENSPAKTWAPRYIYTALKTLKEENLRQKALVISLLDPSSKPYMLLMFPSGVEGEFNAGIVGAEVFQDLIDRQKGQLSAFFIVNAQGQTLGHTVPEYVGKLLVEDPLVAQLMKGIDSSHLGIFKNLRGENVQGLYEQIGQSNIYAVITTPLSALVQNREALRWQFVLMGLGLALIGLGALVLIYNPEKEVVRVNAAPAGPQVAAAPVPNANNRMDAYVKVASVLSHEMRGPLTSILGHVQLLKNQVTEPRAQEHLEKIERESRSARDLVGKLQTFAGEGPIRTSPATVEASLNKALKLVDGKILGKGVKLQKNISTRIELPLAADLMTKAIENVLLNAIEAMERAPQKNLEVSLKDEDGKAVLEIKDSGEGIAPQDLGKIFDPFFTTKAALGNHTGLGLATALGIFKEFNGEVTATSEKGKGTTIRVVFTPSESKPVSVETKSVPLPPPSAPEPVAVKQEEAPQPLTQVTKTSTKKELPKLELNIDFKPIPKKSAPKAEEPAVAKEEPKVELSPLLVDNSIEKMIDEEVEAAPSFPPETGELADLPPPPAAPAPVAAAAPVNDSFSAKIDKPKIDFKKRNSRIDDLDIVVRRPGERSRE